LKQDCVLWDWSWIKRNPEKDILTEEKLDDFNTRLKASPEKLAWAGKSTAHIGTELLKVQP
jgi:hypothetical protein